MKHRLFWCSLGFCGLIIGAILYGLFRPDTYIGAFLMAVFDFKTPTPSLLTGFLAWYFPDLLWMFSLMCFVYAALLPSGKRLFLYSSFVCLYGILWEVAQKIAVVSGTADPWDVFMYIIASILALMINILKKRD